MGIYSSTCDGSPLTSFAADYREALVGLDYRPGSVARQLTDMGRLSRWMVDEGVEASELTTGRVDEFVAACSGQACRVPSKRAFKEVL